MANTGELMPPTGPDGTDTHIYPVVAQANVPEETPGPGPGERDRWVPPLVMVVLAILVAVAIMLATVHLSRTEDGPVDDTVTVGFVLDEGGQLNFSCQVADDHPERVEGLQHREELDEGSGMLFVFDEPTHVYFIMPNMNFPLDIIFIGENGTVLNVAEAEPEEPGTPSTEYVRYPSDGRAKWVVEINQGICRQHGIGPGTRLVLEAGD